MSLLLRFVPVFVVSTIVLSGCTATPAPVIDQAVTIDNCGAEVTFDAAPERVITIKSSTTEMLLALGLEDRIVGTAFQDGPVPDQWADAAAGLTSLSEQFPSEEVVLENEPDLVYAGWESAFSAETAGERAELASLGVATYVSPSACRSIQPPKLTFDDVFAEIEQVASIFRVDASSLVAEQRAALEGLEAPGDDRSALWYSSGTDTPYVGAGIGAPQLVLETLGLDNVAGAVDATWAPFTWESVVDADPYFIVLVDATWNTAASKIASLEANPATASLSAVVEGRYLVVPFAASEAGVRSVDTVVSLATQIRDLDGS